MPKVPLWVFSLARGIITIMNESLYEYLLTTATKTPSHTAVIEEKEGGRAEFTYKELFEQAEQIFSRINSISTSNSDHTTSQTTTQTIIGLHLPNSADFISSLFALTKCGYCALPIGCNSANSNSTHSDEPEDRIKLIAKKYKLSFIISNRPHPYKDLHITKTLPITDTLYLHILNHSEDHKSDINIKSDATFIRLTSGTTGEPKGVVFSTDTVEERIHLMQKNLPISGSDVIIWTLPMAYHFISTILHYVKYGATIVVPKENDCAALVRSLKSNSATIIYASPSEYSRLVKQDQKINLSTLRYALCTSTKLSSFTARSFKQKFSASLAPIYGMIEIGIALGNLSKAKTPISTNVGKPLEGYEVGIFQNESLVEQNDTGELGIKGPGLFDYYASTERDSESKKIDGFFLTGDIAHKTPEGDIQILGRKASAITIGGHTIFPEEIEQVLNSHSHICESRVCSVNDGGTTTSAPRALAAL